MLNFEIWQYTAVFDENTKELIVNGKVYKPSVRTYSQMKNLYLNKDKNLSENFGLYYMYRWVYGCNEDEKLFEKYNLRYDITIIIPKIIWKEYNKTFWHYHPKNEIWRYYEEIYEVLYGKAIYLQQNNWATIFTEAQEGDVVLMKEGFGHITINPSTDQILVMANIVSNKFKSVYDDFKSRKWGRYYLTIDWWVKNTNYKDNIPLLQTNETKLNFSNLYQTFLQSPEKFYFLD